jgi:hypothetical protein
VGKILALLSGWQGYAAVAAFCLLAGSLGTWRVMSWHEQAQQVQVITRVVKQIEKQQVVTEKVVTKYVAVKAADAENTRTIIQEVPVYVSKESDDRCSINLGTVRLWDRAVHGPVPDAAAGADDAPSGLACSDIAKAFAEAAGQYDATAHQLVALQDWVRGQREAAAPAGRHAPQ